MTVGWKRWRRVPRKRSRSKPDKTPVIEALNRLRKAGGTLVTVGEVCEFISQTFTQTPGAPPLWLRLCRAMSLRFTPGGLVVKKTFFSRVKNCRQVVTEVVRVKPQRREKRRDFGLEAFLCVPRVSAVYSGRPSG